MLLICIPPGVDDEAKAASRRATELPEPPFTKAPSGLRPEPTLHDGKQREIGRQSVLTEDGAEARQVGGAARETDPGRLPERPLGAEPVLPHVNARMGEAVELRGRRNGRRQRADAGLLRWNRAARRNAYSTW